MKKQTLKIIERLLCLGMFLVLTCIPVSGKDFTVVIDAGHGGHDPGAIGKISKEKNINLNVALQLGKKIQQNCKDVKVIYTRNSDVFIPLDKRAEIANSAKADLFISIHTNAVAKGNTVKGTETYTLGLARSEANLEVAKRENSVILIEDDYKQRYAGFNPNSSESYIMFEFIQDKHMEQSVKLAKLVQGQFRNYARRIDRGVHQAGFLVLRATTMPSILVELGYISTLEEERYLNSKTGIEKLAGGIYHAFLIYKEEHEKPLLAAKKDLNTIENGTPVKDETTKKGDVQPEKETVLTVNINKAPVKTVESVANINEKPVFKIQILTSSKPLKKTDRQLKGLSPVNYYKENGIYKYTYEESTDYNKILKIKKTIISKFKDAFIIAFRNGERIDVQKAIREFKNNRY